MSMPQQINLTDYWSLYGSIIKHVTLPPWEFRLELITQVTSIETPLYSLKHDKNVEIKTYVVHVAQKLTYAAPINIKMTRLITWISYITIYYSNIKRSILPKSNEISSTREMRGPSSWSVVTWVISARFFTSPQDSPSGVSQGHSMPHCRLEWCINFNLKLDE